MGIWAINCEVNHTAQILKDPAGMVSTNRLAAEATTSKFFVGGVGEDTV